MAQHVMHRRLLVVALALIFSGWLGWLVLPVPAASQAKYLGTKFVDVDALITRFDAAIISKVTIGDQEVQPGRSVAARETAPGTPFQADEDWLKNMSIFIKNRTDRVIVYAEVELIFPGNGDDIQVLYTIRVGQRPEWARYYKDGTKMKEDPTKKRLVLAPGKTLEIRVADYIDQIQSRVEEKLPFSQITRVNISRRNFYFENGMRWDGASYEVPMTNHPGYYTKLSGDYFPGNPSQYPARE